MSRSVGDGERRQSFLLWFRGEVVGQRLAVTVILRVQVVMLREVEAKTALPSPIKFPGGVGVPLTLPRRLRSREMEAFKDPSFPLLSPGCEGGLLPCATGFWVP